LPQKPEMSNLFTGDGTTVQVIDRLRLTFFNELGSVRVLESGDDCVDLIVLYFVLADV